jgi:hypothetical protein
LTNDAGLESRFPVQTFPYRSTVVRDGFFSNPSGDDRYSPIMAPVFASTRAIAPRLSDNATLTYGKVDVALRAFSLIVLGVAVVVLMKKPLLKSADVVYVRFVCANNGTINNNNSAPT